jgi:hypothetical protein
VVWAFVLVCIAGIAIVVIRSRRPAEEPKPIVAVPVPTPKRTPIGPQLRAKSTTAQPPLERPKSGQQPPLERPASTTQPPPVSSAAPIAAVLMADSEPIVASPLDVIRLDERTDAVGSYQAPELAFDPASAPEIPLAEHPRHKPPTLPPARPETADETEIPVAPEAGLRIRAKRPSSAPPPIAAEQKKGTPGRGVVVRKPPTIPPDPHGTPAKGVALRSKTPGAVQQIVAPDAPPVAVPEALANRVRYTTLTANISHVGIDAKREDGFARVVMWPDVVGIVARRLPASAPYEGITFIDLVSTAGATLRILPWTQLTGDAILGDGVERARALCQLVAARCRGAKLDPATRTFIGSHGQAAQLPDEETLAAHDKRLA